MVKQTAGRDSLNDFAPKFAELNDDVLFGEVWSREDKLLAKAAFHRYDDSVNQQGNCGQFLDVPSDHGEEKRRDTHGDGRDSDPSGILCRLAECLGSVPYGKGSVCGGS